MAFIPDQQINTGSFVQQTPIFDVGRLYEIDVNSEEFKELIVRLYQQVNNVSLALNNKISGYYIEEEFVTGANYFNPNSTFDNQLELRPEFTKTFNIGALPLGVLPPVAHGLAVTNTWQFTHIYGAATKNTAPFESYPIPYAGAAGSYISLNIDGTNIYLDNNSGIAFTSCIVTLKYLKY